MGYCYTNKKGEKWYLHVKVGRGGNLIFYFSKDEVDSVDLPFGYIVVEGKNGVPFLKKLK